MTVADPAAERHQDLSVHPDLREPLVAYRGAVGDGGLGAIADVFERRRVFAESTRRATQGRTRPADVRVDSYAVPGPTGSPEVKTRLYRPTRVESAPVPAWIYVHGGGMALGDLDSSDLTAAHLAAESGCAILSVDYRLAPEARFPAPLDDCTAALSWLHDQAQEVGVDAGRIGVYGVSAGGALAASLAQRSRDGVAPRLAKQMLVYPMLDDRGEQRVGMPDAVAGTWSRGANARAWDDYLGPEADRESPSRYAVPARAESLHGLPSSYLEVGSIDILAPEVLSYAGRLLTSGVPLEIHVHQGAYHAFDAVAAGSPFVLAARTRRIRAMTEI